MKTINPYIMQRLDDIIMNCDNAELLEVIDYIKNVITLDEEITRENEESEELVNDI